MDWFIAALAGWLCRGWMVGTEKVPRPNVFTGSEVMPTPVAKVPDTETALAQLDGIEQRIHRTGNALPVDAVAQIRSALTGTPAETGGPKRE